MNDDQYCIDLAKKYRERFKRILKKGGVITAQVGSKTNKTSRKLVQSVIKALAMLRYLVLIFKF